MLINMRIAISDSLSRVSWMDCMVLLLGVVFISEFYAYLFLGYFTPSGFSAHIQDIVKGNDAPLFWNALLIKMADYGLVLAPLSGVIMLILSCSLLLLLARGISALLFSLYFFVVWISTWVYPGVWIFEFLFPATLGLCVAFANLPQWFSKATLKERVLGHKFFGDLALHWIFLLILIVAVVIWYVTVISHNPTLELNHQVALLSAVSVGVLILCLAGIDSYRNSAPRLSDFSHPIFLRLHLVPWFDVMALIIGAMLVIQIYADFAVLWFTVQGYTELTYSYAVSSGAPGWYKAFLFWSSEHARFLMPIQMVFEISMAVLLSLLLLRGPVLLATGLFLMMLTFSEFGVSARWPAVPDDFTWTWELLFATVTCFIAGLHQLPNFLRASTWREAVFGRSFFGTLSLRWQWVVAVIGASFLWFAGTATHVFGSQYPMISLKAGLSYFVLLFILIFLERFRK